jgi:hypothetical protein
VTKCLLIKKSYGIHEKTDFLLEKMATPYIIGFSGITVSRDILSQKDIYILDSGTAVPWALV